MAKKIKFGDRHDYQTGDRVLVKNNPGSVYTIECRHTEKTIAEELSRNSNNPRQLEFVQGVVSRLSPESYRLNKIIFVDVSFLKPASVAEISKYNREQEEFQARSRAAKKENEEWLEKLQVLDLDYSTIDINKMMIPSIPSLGPYLSSLVFEDIVAIRSSRSLGYKGCPALNYTEGSRVRIREGLSAGSWGDRISGMTGTVQDPGILSIFPVSPMQPRGICIKWDDGKVTNMYVTNLEPE
jgi:hypothetical protein